MEIDSPHSTSAASRNKHQVMLPNNHFATKSVIDVRTVNPPVPVRVAAREIRTLEPLIAVGQIMRAHVSANSCAYVLGGAGSHNCGWVVNLRGEPRKVSAASLEKLLTRGSRGAKICAEVVRSGCVIEYLEIGFGSRRRITTDCSRIQFASGGPHMWIANELLDSAPQVAEVDRPAIVQEVSDAPEDATLPKSVLVAPSDLVTPLHAPLPVPIPVGISPDSTSQQTAVTTPEAVAIDALASLSGRGSEESKPRTTDKFGSGSLRNGTYRGHIFVPYLHRDIPIVIRKTSDGGEDVMAYSQEIDDSGIKSITLSF